MPDESYRESYPRTELYGADGNAQQQITLNKGKHSKVMASARSSNAALLHTYTVEFSYNNTNWYTHYTSAAAEQERHLTMPDVAARYWRLTSDAVAGVHTVDLILAATP